MIDTRELDQLAARLGTVRARIDAAAAPVVLRAGANIARTMRRDASGHRYLPGLAAAVGFDATRTAQGFEVEAGFAKRGQGNLANVAAFGTVHNAPVMDITRGLAEEVPRFTRFLATAAGSAIL